MGDMRLHSDQSLRAERHKGPTSGSGRGVFLETRLLPGEDAHQGHGPRRRRRARGIGAALRAQAAPGSQELALEKAAPTRSRNR